MAASATLLAEKEVFDGKTYFIYYESSLAHFTCTLGPVCRANARDSPKVYRLGTTNE